MSSVTCQAAPGSQGARYSVGGRRWQWLRQGPAPGLGRSAVGGRRSVTEARSVARPPRRYTDVPVHLEADGDDLLLRTDGGSDLADLAAARERAGVPAAVGAAVVPGADAGRYGVLVGRDRGRGVAVLEKLVEKPVHFDEGEAHANVSRSLLPGEILAYFRALSPALSGEYQATDAIEAYAGDHDVLIHRISGTYFDCGNTTGWLAANLAAARALEAEPPRSAAETLRPGVGWVHRTNSGQRNRAPVGEASVLRRSVGRLGAGFHFVGPDVGPERSDGP